MSTDNELVSGFDETSLDRWIEAHVRVAQIRGQFQEVILVADVRELLADRDQRPLEP